MPPDRRDRQPILDGQILANAEALRRVLLGARDRIEKQILRATQKGNIASAAWLRDNLYQDLKGQYLVLQGDLDGWAATSVENGARTWVGLAATDAGTKPKTAWNRFSTDYLNLMIQQYTPSTMGGLAAVGAGDLAPALGGMLKRDIDILRQVVMDTTRLQAATGMTAKEWRRTVQAEVMEQTGDAWNFIDKSGKTWTANNYFNMLNRTLSANTARDSYLSSMAEDGYDLATIEGGIPPNCCPFCLKWVGKIVSVSGTSKKYPSLEEAKKGRVFHPRCRHYLAVMFPGEEEEAAEEEARVRAQAKKLGNPKTQKLISPNDVKPPKKKPKDAPKPPPKDVNLVKPAPKKPINVVPVAPAPINEVAAAKIDPGQEALDAVLAADKRGASRLDRVNKQIQAAETKRVEADQAAFDSHRAALESAKATMSRDEWLRLPVHERHGLVETQPARQRAFGNLANARNLKAELEKDKNKILIETRDKSWDSFLFDKGDASKFEHEFDSKGWTGKRRETVDQGADFTRRFWGERPSIDGLKVKIRKRGRGRSYYDPGSKAVLLEKSVNPGVVAHELTHGLEAADPDLHKRAVDFLVKRNTGGKIERLKERFPGSKYEPQEISVDDDWKNPYSGKIYVGKFKSDARAFANKVSGKDFDISQFPELIEDIQHTEVLSMGIEKLYNDPVRFAKEEPEYFKFMINTAKGAPA